MMKSSYIVLQGFLCLFLMNKSTNDKVIIIRTNVITTVGNQSATGIVSGPTPQT